MPPSATSGRRRSVFVLILSIGIALGFQYGVAPYLVDMTVSNFVRDSWVDGCDEYENNIDLQKSCAGNNGNFRASSATFLFFVCASIAAALKPTANREAWPAKYILYLFLVAATVFIPSEPLFSDIFLNIARSKCVLCSCVCLWMVFVVQVFRYMTHNILLLLSFFIQLAEPSL